MKTKVYVYNDVCDANEIPMIKEVLYQWHAKDDEITDIAIFTDGSMGCFDRVINKWYLYKEPIEKYKSIVHKIRQVYANFKRLTGNVDIKGVFIVDTDFITVKITFYVGEYPCCHEVTRCQPEDWADIAKYMPYYD